MQIKLLLFIFSLYSCAVLGFGEGLSCREGIEPKGIKSCLHELCGEPNIKNSASLTNSNFDSYFAFLVKNKDKQLLDLEKKNEGVYP